jgi:asparagine synthase (glutamine-hydrolysing)
MKGRFDLAEPLHLSRDAFGQTAVLYCRRGAEVWVASRIQELREMQAPLGQLDRDALSDYLELGFVPAPATMWSNVRKLPAGHELVLGPGDATEQRRTFELPLPGSAERRPSRIAVRGRLEEAVHRALEGAVRPAALLASDVPSAALVALMTRASGRVRTFSAAFDDADDALLEPARRVAQRFRSDHHPLRVAVKPADDVPQALQACSEPCADGELVLAWAALKAIARETDLLLVADGADELFAGHPRYLRAARLPRLERAGRATELLRHIAPRRHRGRLQKAAAALRSAGAPRARSLVEIFSADERRALLGSAARVARHGAAEGLLGADAALAFDLEFALPDSVLARLGAVAGAAGIAARPAFLDEALARAVVPPPARHKLGRRHGNRLLREAVADLLPRELLAMEWRRPQPPLAAWLRGPLRPMLHDLVRPPSARIRTLLDPRAIDLSLAHSLAPGGDARQAWSLLALELWARER